MNPERQVQTPENTMRYGIYQVTNKLKGGQEFVRSFIVLRNEYDVIVRFTRLHLYAGSYQNKIYRPITSDPKGRLYNVCGMLNYILADHGAEYGVRHVFGITRDMLQAFFNAYATEELSDGSTRKVETVKQCVTDVTGFMKNLGKEYSSYMKLPMSGLYISREYVDERGDRKVHWVPSFQVTGIPGTGGIFRDIPTKAVEILISMAFRYSPDIAFGLCMQAFAGMRAGEVCNTRQDCSPYGPGIVIFTSGGKVDRVEIDLNKELVLRSDGVNVGKIKKGRTQAVYNDFIGSFMDAYEMHKNWLRKQHFEEEYAPMFVTRDGKALTYERYRQKFKSLINDHLRPYLLMSDDPELHLYGQLLCENELSTHALRHWFTVQLVLRRAGVADLQSWRGDSSPESALTYLRNKGELVEQLRASNERFIDILKEVAKEIKSGKISF